MTNEYLGLEKVIKRFELKIEKDSDLFGFDVYDYLRDLYSVVKKIWENIDLDFYTDHSIGHSERMMENFLKLEKNYKTINSPYDPDGKFSDFERIVFISSTLLHDIGMQFNKWKLTPELYEYIKEAPQLNKDDIRERHCELGQKLISAFKYSDKWIDENWPGIFYKRDTLASFPFFYASSIAFQHADNKILQSMLEDHATYQKKQDSLPTGGEIFRPYLLSVIIRLCDLLDCSFRRIRVPSSINSSDLPILSKKHWAACMFVSDVSTKEDPSTILIHWRTPEESSPLQEESIRAFLEKFLVQGIIPEIDRNNEILKECKEYEFSKMFTIMLAEKPEHAVFPKSFDFSTLINDSGSKEIISFPPIPKVVNVPATSYLKRESFSSETTLIDDLKDWFNKNMIRRHYELVQGEHTNSYLFCRSLVSDQNLISKLSSEISKRFVNEKISNIVAVGTSAIPLGINVALRLGASVSYTFYNNGGNTPYTNSEMEISVKKGNNILIIDDVISSGKVVSQVLDRLRIDEKHSNKIFHYAIFRLGDREYQIDRRINSYSNALHINDDIQYFPGNDCALCKAHQPFVREIDGTVIYT